MTVSSPPATPKSQRPTLFGASPAAPAGASPAEPSEPRLACLYGQASVDQARQGSRIRAPRPLSAARHTAGFELKRLQLLQTMGRRREQRLHRPPEWCTDPLTSGSGLFPPRLLADEWFTENELMTLRSLEAWLAQTGQGAALARDLLALRIFDVGVHIVVDDSGSMAASMFGFEDVGGGGWTQSRIQKAFGGRAFGPESLAAFASCPLSPSTSRWAFARDAVLQWEAALQLLGLCPRCRRLSEARPAESAAALFQAAPSGRASLTARLREVLLEAGSAAAAAERTQLVLVVTDGEPDSRADFDGLLDEVKDGFHGDVQLCFVGLSLEAQDLEWFDDDGCEDARIRTIRPWELEQQQMLWQRALEHPGQYNFAMHTMRVLVTNLFPSDYDYKAALRGLRHRLYSTLKAVDRRATGKRDTAYMAFGSDACIVPVVEGLRSLLGVTGTKAVRAPGPEAATEEAVAEELRGEAFTALLAALKTPEPGPGSFPAILGADRSSLALVQQALAVLQPGELTCRELKFSDPSRNVRALRRAAGYLRRAVACCRR